MINILQSKVQEVEDSFCIQFSHLARQTRLVEVPTVLTPGLPQGIHQGAALGVTELTRQQRQ
ncbi:hypothetical protein SDC9_101764 [bioreactor metagenome]|uniref:Uncharacterized protein n=1 Tax=bioreactor metagenome TaxID=1076179 RepID=A0A645ARN7_9ZZZZ